MYNSASIDVKTGSPDPADFATVPAAICQGRTTIARTARAVKHGSSNCGSSRKKQDGECRQFASLFVRPWHIAAASTRYAKGLCAICQSRGSRPRVLAKSAGSGEPVFTYCRWMRYCTDRSFEMADF
jgi:hypothetical protein